MYLFHGRVRLVLQYAKGQTLVFETTNTYNGGEWVGVEAARAVRDGLETGVLRVNLNGAREDLMNTIKLPESAGDFSVGRCRIYFGGVPPTEDLSDYLGGEEVSSRLRGFLGSMRKMSVSNPRSNTILNPLYSERNEADPRFGVKPYCKEKVFKFECVAFDFP